jgi:hypothetical protein
MRHFLTKPRRLPGLTQPRTRTRLSIGRTLVLASLVLVASLLWVAGLRFTSILLTYVTTGAAVRHSLDELPIWHAPACIVFMYLAAATIIWRFKLHHRLLHFIRAGEHETRKG